MTTPITSDIAERLNYHDGMFLTSAYMTLEQNYFVNWLRLQNQYLYTPGVLNGMAVQNQNNTLVVGSGVAFDSNGNFLVFPGNSGNALTVPSNASNPFAVYAVYPNNSAAVTDVVNQAAVLQIGSPTMAPANSVILATVSLDSTGKNIVTVTDSRVPVQSLLPANLSGTAATLQGTAVNLDGAQHGSLSVATTTLLKPGDSVSAQVYFLEQQVPAFTAAPSVNVTVLGTTPYAVAVSAVTTAQFTVTVTAVQTQTGEATPVQLNWIALPTP